MASSNRTAWVFSVSMCLLVMTLLLLAGTIVLAIIPIYIANRNVDVITETGDELLTAGYASDLNDGRSLTLADTSSLSSQLAGTSDLSSNVLSLDQGGFLTSTAASRKKRQSTTNTSSITCEQASGLSGDLFVAQYRIKYPNNCNLKSCRRRFLLRVMNALRMRYRRTTVQMNFTSVGIRNVQLVFCGFFSSGNSDCTTETKSNIYIADTNNTIYSFNPTSLAVAQVGILSCANTSGLYLYSIALQRNGNLWVLFNDGRLFLYNLVSKQCSATSFNGSQNSISIFSMTFVKSATSSSESLYLSIPLNSGIRLGVLNTNTFIFSSINNNTNLSSFASLTAVNDGRLYGLFYVNRSSQIIARINPNNAATLTQYSLNQFANSSRFPNAIASYKSNFFIFATDFSNTTDIYLTNTAANTTTTSATISQAVIGATSSSCLGAL